MPESRIPLVKFEQHLRQFRGLRSFKVRTFQLLDHREAEAAELRAPVLSQEFNDFRWSLWEGFEETGVYILWSEDKSHCYVGKCSQGEGSYLGARIWSHFGTLGAFRRTLEKDGVTAALREHCQKQFPAHWLTVIAVQPGFSWIASALEEFLIKEIPADWNTIGRKAKKTA